MATSSGSIQNYRRGKSVGHIDFDPTRPFSTAGGAGDIYRGDLIIELHPNGSLHRYSQVVLKSMRCGTDDKDTVSTGRQP